MNGRIVSVIVPPYLKDYIIFINGGSHPVPLCESSKLLPGIHASLTPAPKNWHRPLESSNVLFFQIPFNEVIEARKKFYISAENNVRIKMYLAAKFHYDFVSWVSEKHIHENIPIKKAILNFIVDNDISQLKDNYETLAKIFQRWRKDPRKQKEKKIEKKVPDFHRVLA